VEMTAMDDSGRYLIAPARPEALMAWAASAEVVMGNNGGGDVCGGEADGNRHGCISGRVGEWKEEKRGMEQDGGAPEQWSGLVENFAWAMISEAAGSCNQRLLLLPCSHLVSPSHRPGLSCVLS